MKKALPLFLLRNRQRRVRVDLQRLADFGERALAVAFPLRRPRSDIADLECVTVVLLSDAAIGTLHRIFSRDPLPTDVLTFQHGDIAIGVEMALRQARSFGAHLGDELELYLVHGFLHLCGFEDGTAKARTEMRRMEKRILRQCKMRR